MSEDCDLEEVAALLEDDCARTILAETSLEPMAVQELMEVTGASDATIYRRIEDLEACDLLAARTEPDPDGHHRKIYAARLEQVTVDLEHGEFSVSIDRSEPMADRFTRLIEQI